MTSVDLKSHDQFFYAPDQIGPGRSDFATNAPAAPIADQAAPLFRPEAVNAQPDFLPSAFLEGGAAAARAVGRIVVRQGRDYEGAYQPGGWFGTGFLVAEGVLLTNHHVLNSIEVCKAATIQLNYRNKLDGSADSFEEFTLRPEQLFITSPWPGALDYTFVALDPEARRYGFIPLKRAAYVTRKRSCANIIQHPDGRLQEVVVHDNPVIADNNIVLHYTTDTEAGSSGSPVLDNAWRLIALHHAAASNSTGLTRPDGSAFKYLNEGIKLSSIASDLETRARTGGEDAMRALALFDGINSSTGFFGTLGRESSRSGLEALVDHYRGVDQDIDVGAWNIEWFSNRYEAKLGLVARAIADFNLDIWALVESSPAAAEALVKRLGTDFGLKFDVAHSEPNASTAKQSTSVIWNVEKVRGTREAWPEDIEPWFAVHSTDFNDQLLEAVHGKIFDRYPGLFRFQSVHKPAVDFFLVPLHLKAMAEGSLRREMASKILAAAVSRMTEAGADADWILLGDLNAEIASRNFDPLRQKGLVPLSAIDEEAGSFTYLKSPYKSMIDHVYVTRDLAKQVGSDGFFIVAADKTYPNYVKEVSDHRPIVTRLSLAGGPSSGAPAAGAAAAPPQSLRDEFAKLFGAAPAR